MNKGDLIVCRRPRKELQRNALNYIPCAKCKGFFSRNNIRHHFKICGQKIKRKGNRFITVMGRAVAGRIHHSASEKLKRVVFPILREDEITRVIRYDELIIGFGNKLCLKYTLTHQNDMIRARLRLLGRFLLKVRELKPCITNLTDVYNPENYDYCVAAVRSLAGFDNDKGIFKTPYNASCMGTLLKQIGQVLRSICIKTRNEKKLWETENFLKLVEEDYPVSICKTVYESQVLYKRQKPVVLPSDEDINKLSTYLKGERTRVYKILEEESFSNCSWRLLNETTLISIQLFNRKRPGELQRALIDDLQTCEGIKKEERQKYSSLSKYMRMTIRGKKGRTVPILLTEELLKCVKMILKYRINAGVHPNNPYIFGVFGSNKHIYGHLRACVLMKKFSNACGATKPFTLRGTALRKHVATKCISLDMGDNDINILADFMGHHEKIHKSHYRQSILTKDLAVSQFLEYALGNEKHDSDSDDSDDSNESEYEDKNTGEEKKIIHIASEKIENKMEPRETQNKRPTRKHYKKVIVKDSDSEESDTDAKRVTFDVQKRVRKIVEDSDDENIRPRKQRKASLYGPTQRKKWSVDEKNSVYEAFGREISEARLPSGNSILAAKQKYPQLQGRSVPQIRTWIHNVVSGKTKK